MARVRLTTYRVPALRSHRIMAVLATLVILLAVAAALSILMVLAPWLFKPGAHHAMAQVAAASAAETTPAKAAILGGIAFVFLVAMLLFVRGCNCGPRRRRARR